MNEYWLLPCPFCGWSAELNEYTNRSHVDCVICGAEMKSDYHGRESTKEDLTKDVLTKWNKRQ